MPHLVVRERGRVVLTVALRAELRVGRHADNDLVLGDRHASRHHASFRERDGEVTVADVGSRHGTLVNGERVSGERALADGDVVQIGNVLLTFRATESAEPEPSLLRTSHHQAFEAARERGDDEARRLEVLYEVSRAIGAGGAPREVAARILDCALAVLGCQRGVVGIFDGAPTAAISVVRHALGALPGEIVVSRTLIDRIVRERQSVLVGEREAPLTLARQGVRSAMGAPLLVGERVLGFIYVDDRARADLFSEQELDFLTALAHLAAAALEQADRLTRSRAVAEALRDEHPTPELLGSSPPMRALKDRVARYARAADTTVLIHGESGTGKELVARTLHALSPRADEPFVTVNCAAIPDTLLESELFGHEKGAFTGANKARRGRFALAHRGTLFLDEVADLSLAAQAKLLRVLEDGEVTPLGAEQPISVDVRVLSATHKSLEAEIAAGRFREDLYYRLAVGEVNLPPLRDRGDDIVALAELFLGRAGRATGQRVTGFSQAAKAALVGYGWPGNVRQLMNEIERAVILSDGPIVDLPDLRARLNKASTSSAPGLSLAESFAQLDVTERQLVEKALAEANGNVSDAARRLGISRIMLRRRMERYGSNET